MKRLVKSISVLTLLVILAAPGVANAQEKKEGWTFDVGTFLWATDLDTELTVNTTKIKGDKSFKDLLDKLQGAFSGEIVARHGKLSLSVDSVNFYLSDDLPAPVLGGTRNVDISMNWIQGLVGYRILEKSFGKNGKLAIEPTIGYRQYFNRITIDKVGGGELEDRNPNWGDFVTGGRIGYAVNEKFGFWGSGTYGGFGWGDSSKYSWTAGSGVDWNFAKNKTLRVGYLVAEFKKEESRNGIINDVSFMERLSGPLVSLIWHF